METNGLSGGFICCIAGIQRQEGRYKKRLGSQKKRRDLMQKTRIWQATNLTGWVFKVKNKDVDDLKMIAT
ncbi:MAG: hypothetical protein Kow0065_16160 [Methylomicrobium sp.]